MTNNEDDRSALFELLFNGLNEQGYLFQERCCDILRRAERHTEWVVKGYDYPVSLKDRETKVDIVLERQSNPGDPVLFAVVKCKRADPDYEHWLFGAPGLPSGHFVCSLTTLEQTAQIPRSFPRVRVSRLQFQIDTYGAENWTEVKKRPRATGKIPSSQTIEDAFHQVLTGVGGLVHDRFINPWRPDPFEVSVIPIVITTANLYVAHYDIRDVEERTGKIARDKVLFGPKGQDPEQKGWVFVDYSVGDSLTSSEMLDQPKQRSIFVVNAEYIQSFFTQLRPS